MATVAKKRLIRLFNRLLHTALVFLGLIVTAAVAYFFIEGLNGIDGAVRALYWSVVTGFTVGFGDVLPSGIPGMLLCIFYIPASAITFLFLGAHIVADVIDDRTVNTDEEQDWTANMLCKIAAVHNIEHDPYPDSHA